MGSANAIPSPLTAFFCLFAVAPSRRFAGPFPPPPRHLPCAAPPRLVRPAVRSTESPNVRIFRLSARAGPAAAQGEARLYVSRRQSRAGGGAIRRADPVWPHYRSDERGAEHGAALTWGDLLPTVAAWAGFGLFSIFASMAVGLNADRLAHRSRLDAMAEYFDHVLDLPLSFHSNVHSGRLLQSMLEGASAMFGLWLSFFRENCASFFALLLLLPATLLYNWRARQPADRHGGAVLRGDDMGAAPHRRAADGGRDL